MKKILLFCIASTLSTLLSSQTIWDSVFNKIERRLDLYEQTHDINDIYMIGEAMPHFPFETKAIETLFDWRVHREKMSMLYIRWFDYMLKAGFDLDFDMDDPENQTFIWSVSVDGSESLKRIFELERLKNEELSKIRNHHYSFDGGMTNFRCYYRRAYKTQKTHFRVFKRQLKSYDKQNKAKEAKLMLHQFKKAAKECKCWWDDIWDKPEEKNK